MFAPDAGVSEDPATGSAAAAFPGQLALAGALKEGASEINIEQGVELGRPSRIRVRVETGAGAVRRVAVGGFAVPVMSGEIDA
jgi:trans-2,3-dihydro-3-hydroxyanthranilate isomerase